MIAAAALQKRDPGAGIGGDHRSAFSSANVRLKRTFPRIWRSRAYAWDAATNCSPVRTVWVMPVPLAFCAFSRSSAGISTVIFRAAGIAVLYHTQYQYSIW